VHYIFRRSDGEYLYGCSGSQLPNETAACLANEGGTLADYVIVEGRDLPTGMLPVLSGGTVDLVANPKSEARRAAKTRIAELRMVVANGDGRWNRDTAELLNLVSRRG